MKNLIFADTEIRLRTAITKNHSYSVSIHFFAIPIKTHVKGFEKTQKKNFTIPRYP